MLSFLHRCLLPALTVLAMWSMSAAQQTLGELYASDASVKGAVVLAGSGTSVLSGSSIEAGALSATLKLERGGTLLVCPGTKLSITASQNARQLMFSLNSGNLEMNYPLGAAADTLLTPDLHLLMPGPGRVHIAVRVNAKGDTCVQSLSSNATAVVVSETMGDATYQVRPDDAVVFQGGHISGAVPSRQSCGCPEPPRTYVAKATPPPGPPAEPQPPQPSTKPVPAPSADEHVSVEAPFVFRADDRDSDISENIATLRLEHNQVVQLETVVLPPPPVDKTTGTESAKKDQRHGWFSKVGAFFATLFH